MAKFAKTPHQKMVGKMSKDLEKEDYGLDARYLLYRFAEG
jgi:hypothetical protein